MNPVLNSQCRTVASSPPAFGEAPVTTCCVFSVCHQAQSWKILCISMLNCIQWNIYIYLWCLAHLGSLHFYTILVARNWSDMTFITLIWQIHDAEKTWFTDLTTVFSIRTSACVAIFEPPAPSDPFFEPPSAVRSLYRPLGLMKFLGVAQWLESPWTMRWDRPPRPIHGVTR